MIKKILLTIFAILILLIIAWRVDRTYFHPYLPNLSDMIRSIITTYKFTVPKNKADCETKGGAWKKIGLGPAEECNLSTTDGGKVCDNSDQCEGVCLAELSNDDLRKGMSGKFFRTNGRCSDWIKVVGCRAYVFRGWATVVCVD